MRTALAAAVVLAATSLAGLGSAAPAQAAEACHQHYSGLTISHVERHHGVSCDAARAVIDSALTGRPALHTIGWTCSSYGSHHIPYSCWKHHSDQWLTFFVVVGDGTGPGGF